MADMKVDYDKLDELKDDLKTALDVIGNEFESMLVLSQAVGNGDLGGKVVEFGNSWNKHRFDIRDQLQWLHDSVKNIQEKLAETDELLASGLTTPAVMPATATGTGGAPTTGNGSKKAI